MKKTFLFALGLFLAQLLFAQDSLKMTRLARWDDESLPVDQNGIGLQYSGCWGLALNGREYAILGGAAHVLFFDITDPTHPELIGKFAGTDATAWREFKSYKNRVYAVSDQTSEGLMIFDMTNAPDTVVRTYYSTEFLTWAHTITLDTTSGRIYLNGSDVEHQGLLVLDVSQDPDKPVFLASTALAGGYIHDSYVRNDTIYASSGNEGYFVFDFTDPLHPDTLAQTLTGGYNHNSWLNPEGTYAYYTEEIPSGRPVQIVDLHNLGTDEGIEIAGSFLDTFSIRNPSFPFWRAIPHNVYIRDHLLFNSQYEDGLLVYDISEPTDPVLVGRYDTHPQNTLYNGYRGNWGNYPWLPSGTIIASDMQNGLQLLKLNLPVGVETPKSGLQVETFPNPAFESLTIRLRDLSSEWSYRLFNAVGQAVREQNVSGASQQVLSLKNLPKGLYFIEIQTIEKGKAVKRIVVE